MLLLIWIIGGLVVHGQEKAPEAKKNQESTQPPAPSNATNTPSIVVNKQTTYEQGDGAEKKPKGYFARLISPENVPNIGLLVVGVIGIIIAICSLRAIQRQILQMVGQRKLMSDQLAQMATQAAEMGKQTALIADSVAIAKESADAAKASAEAARDNASAILNSERAWLEIDFAAPQIASSDEEEIDDYGAYSVQIKNRGRTIARIESFQIDKAAIRGEFNPNTFEKNSSDFDVLLGSDDKITIIPVLSIPSMFASWISIRNDADMAYIRIGVRYRDAIDPKILHESSAIYLWNTRDEEPMRLSSYNVYS